VLYYERNLPHWQPPHRDLFLTWRLYGSLPRAALDALRHKTFSSPGKKFQAFEATLDHARFGPAYLSKPNIAELLINSILDAERANLFKIHSYVVMPNHVHILLAPQAPLRKITQFVKGKSAREINLLLGLSGKYLWQKESFDHWVRSPAEFDRIMLYIRDNPVKAKLVHASSAWPWLYPK
jgi:putative transposase